MAHLAARPGFHLAVEMKAETGRREKSRQRSTSSPMRLRISMAPSRAAAPSGHPQIARKCCSNCEVCAPSIVQWPEL